MAKLTAVGVIKPFRDALPDVLAALTDATRLRAARLHPLAILVAFRA